LSRQGDTPGAIREWQTAARLDPKNAQAHVSLGDALDTQGRTAEALVEWREAIELQPNDARTLRRAAWVMATAPDAAIRNGGEALAFAIRAMELSGGKDAQTLDTLAAAYAGKGDFDDAVPTARRALARATQENQPALAEEIRNRIALYQAEQPFRDAGIATVR
jgi:Flp pilus assembly protein TadD